MLNERISVVDIIMLNRWNSWNNKVIKANTNNTSTCNVNNRNIAINNFFKTSSVLNIILLNLRLSCWINKITSRLLLRKVHSLVFIIIIVNYYYSYLQLLLLLLNSLLFNVLLLLLLTDIIAKLLQQRCRKLQSITTIENNSNNNSRNMTLNFISCESKDFLAITIMFTAKTISSLSKNCCWNSKSCLTGCFTKLL